LSCLFWFHPLVWFVSRRLLAEREQACDERVLEVGGERGSYASSILKVVRFCFGWKVAGVSGAAAGSNLRRRIEKIMHEQKNPKATRWQRALPVGAATLALAFTAGAGLLSHLRGGAAAAQDASRTRVRRPSAEGQGERMKVRSLARTQAGEGRPATQEILDAPESVIYFEQAADSPLVITDAKLKMITRAQLRQATDEGADYLDEEKSEFLITLPTVSVTNVSGKAIKEVGIGFAKEGQVHVIMGYVADLKPGEAQTFRSEWNRRNMLMPGTFADVSVRVVWATYADGSAWGMLPRVPHPPPPPPPPLPGGTSLRRIPQPMAQGSGAAGDAQATVVFEMGGGRGTGQGVGAGSGSGSGGGAGAGSGAGEARGGGAVRAQDLGGKAISAPPPAYPAIARSARAQGAVTVRVTVDENGQVIAAEAVSGHPLLRGAAEEAARVAVFSPTLLSGKPVKVTGRLSYNF
ncbi:MAG TPA: M56 family metallopeptidase, partial [Pyrinomonadaceae bacterium]|nr:M56 family metallopeptidase [Pyrinomonadaceae bacterium]